MGKSIVRASDGNLILAGNSISNISGDVSENNQGTNSADVWVVKIDTDGNKIWDRRFGGSQSDGCFDMIQKSNGNLSIIGKSKSGIDGNKDTPNYGRYDFWHIEFNLYGTKVNDNTYGNDEANTGRKILQSSMVI